MTDPLSPAAPHVCPSCGEPSYIPFGLNTRCVSRDCEWYDYALWVEHMTSLPDVEDPTDDDEEDYLDDDYPTDPSYQHGFPPIRLTPQQQKAMKLLDAAMSKLPAPTMDQFLNIPTLDDLTKGK
jgi:hypothetical protein